MKYTSLLLVLICIIVFILQSSFQITDSIALTSSKVLEQPWTIVTSVFAHGSLEHLIFNMFALALFGFILETIIGTQKFLLLFFTAGIVSSFAAMVYPSSLGASGAIFGVMAALAILRPRQVVWFWGVPIPMIITLIIWTLIDLVGLFVPSNIANAAHLAGLAIGILFALKIRKQFKITEDQRSEAINKDKPTEEEIQKWEEDYL